MINTLALYLFYGYAGGAVIFLLIFATLATQAKRNPIVSLQRDIVIRVISCIFMAIFWPIMLRDMINTSIKLRNANR